MLLRILLCGLAAITAYGAEDSWKKVKELKTGIELRIIKIGSKQPLLATMDEANDERIIVMVKNEQTAIDKDQIERVDWRPPKPLSSRMSRETKTSVDPPPQTAGPTPRGSTGGPQTNTTNSVIIGGKGEFETIYRRTASSPK